MWEEDSVGKVKVKRNRINKPYERPQKSLIKRVTDSLTGLLPNPSWLSWMKTTTAVREKDDVEPSCSTINRSVALPEESFIFRREDTEKQEESVIEPKADDGSESESTSGCSSLVPHPENPRRETRENFSSSLALDKSSLNALSSSLSRSMLNAEQVNQVNASRGWKSLNLGSITRDAVAEDPQGERTFDKASIVSLCLDDSSTQSSRLSAGPSSKRPRFNITAFTSPLSAGPTTLANSSVTASPFYLGRTTYGGASAYRATRAHVATPYAANRRQVSARPTPASADSTILLSSTAKKILTALESMSTPVKDAKRIPLGRKTAQDESEAPFLGFSAAGKRPKLGPPAAKLPVGTPAAVVRKPLLLPEKPVAVAAETPKAPEPQISSTPLAAVQGGGKVRTRVTALTRPSARAAAAEELLEEPELPAVSLPISSLPTFQLFAPSPIVSVAMTTPSAKPATSAAAAPAATEKPKTVSFAPVPFSTAPSSPPSSKPVFRFSAPLVTVTSPPMNGTSLPPVEKPFTFSTPIPVNKDVITAAAASEKVAEKPAEKPAAAQAGWGEQFKPAAGTWECSVCLVRNPSDKSQCTACETPKPGAAAPEIKTAAGFGDKFKPPAGSWTCSVCCVSNPADKTKCVACESPKPGVVPTTVSAAPAAPLTSGFGDKFKAAQGSWTCDVCMITNTAEKVKCAACESPKPGAAAAAPVSLAATLASGFGDKFKAVQGSWNCDVCMITNSAEKAKCAACESPKPGAAAPVAPSFGDKFKPATDTWECSTCMVRNKADVNKCVACETLRPGAAASAAAAVKPTFKFGVPASAEEKKEPTSGATTTGFKFGAAAATETPKAAAEGSGFKFGAAAAPAKPAETSGFKFGAAAPAAGDKTDSVAAPAAKTGFSLGATTSEAAPAAGFKFGAAAAEPAKTDATAESQPKVGFSFGTKLPEAAPVSTFKFGAAPAEGGEKAEAPKAAAFTFGAPSSTAAAAEVTKSSLFATPATTTSAAVESGTKPAPAAVFSFGLASSTPATSAEVKAPTLGGFQFASSSTTTSSSNTVGMLNFGTTLTTSSSGAPLSSFSSAAKESPAKPEAAGGVKVASELKTGSVMDILGGRKDASAEPAKPVFTFGAAAPAASSQPAAQPSFPLFGAKTTAGEPEAKKLAEAPAAKPATLFGSTAAGPTTFAFGAAPAAATTAPAAAAGGLFSAAVTTAPAPATAAAGLFTFGQAAGPAATIAASGTSTLFTFGKTGTPAATAAAPTPAAAAAAPFAFGKGSGSSSNLFQFGKTAEAAASTAASQQPGGFSFTSTAPATTFGAAAAAPAPSFSFGSSAAPVTTSAGSTAPFTFGAAPGPSAAPPFGAPAAAAQQSGVFTFGSQTTSAPAFGSTGPSLSFGTPAAPAAGGFAFGGPAASVTPAGPPPAYSATPSFSFGSTQPQQQQQGVFQFGSSAAAPAASAAQGGFAFNPAAAPSFNFGGATPSGGSPTFGAAAGTPFSSNPFDATGGGSSLANRKIRRAVRRR